MSETFDSPLSAETSEVNIPSFDTEENKPLYLPGLYLFALGHVRAKTDKGVTLSVAQEIWVLKFIGDPYTPTNEWRIQYQKDGSLFMPSHKGVKRFEYFDNPMLKPKMRWKTSAFYACFPGVIVEKAGQVPGSPAPVKQVNWNAVAAKYGQCFEAGLVPNSYNDKQGNPKKTVQFDWDSFKLIQDMVIPKGQMIGIETRYDALKAADEGAGAYPGGAAAPDIKIPDDLPF